MGAHMNREREREKKIHNSTVVIRRNDLFTTSYFIRYIMYNTEYVYMICVTSREYLKMQLMMQLKQKSCFLSEL